MTPSKTIAWQHLAPNPKSCYKQLFVKGTRIRARVLYGMHMSAEEPMSAQEIAAAFDIPVEAVEESIAYCKAGPPEIASDLERERQLMHASGMNDPDYHAGGKYRIVSPEEVQRIFQS